MANFQTIRAKQGKNEFLFGVLWCFLGVFGDKKGRNTNIFLKVREGKRAEMWSLACLLACPLVQVVRASRRQDLPEVGSGPLVVCSLLLSALLLCLCMIALEYGSISRFKGVFRGFPLLDVGLYCFDALRGLWGFCVREWLGGFMA